MTGDPSSRPSDLALNAYLRRAREARQQPAPIFTHPSLGPEERARRTAVAGALLGAAASLVFALISQGTNILLLPGVPSIPASSTHCSPSW